MEKISSDLVVRDENGAVNTVRYDQVNAMLLNEFLKEHRKNENQQATLGELKLAVVKQEKRLAHQDKQIAMLAEAFQRMSAQVRIDRLCSRLVGMSH